MAKPEIPCEASSQGRKRESSEDAIEYEESDDDDVSEESDYDSDDPAYEILEGKADRKIWKQYHKEWDESEGFDISVYPGSSFMAPLVQLHDYLKNPEIKKEYTELCKLAIHHFNSNNEEDNNKIYAFEDIVNVNATYAGGTWYYFTFTARDTTVDDATAADAIKTFQALVRDDINKTVNVSFCRLKKFSCNQVLISDKKKKKKKKKSQQDGKAVTEVEQDKPSLLKSFVPGLVIEELSKGNNRGRKRTHMGFKVAVRYTGKLKENGKIFKTNIGEEKPFEFRLAGGQAIHGLEEGVLGMRVGDRRRITIPPNLGYGDTGYLDVVPPDAWLVYEVELVEIFP